MASVCVITKSTVPTPYSLVLELVVYFREYTEPELYNCTITKSKSLRMASKNCKNTPLHLFHGLIPPEVYVTSGAVVKIIFRPYCV